MTESIAGCLQVTRMEAHLLQTHEDVLQIDPHQAGSSSGERAIDDRHCPGSETVFQRNRCGIYGRNAKGRKLFLCGIRSRQFRAVQKNKTSGFEPGSNCR